MQLQLNTSKRFPFFSLKKDADRDLSFLGITGSEVRRGKMRPTDFAGQIQRFRGTPFVCSRINAGAVADQPMNLYVRKSSKSQKFKYTPTVEVAKKDAQYLLSLNYLQSHRRKAVEIEEITEHRLLELLSTVNPFMNGFDLCELTIILLELTGNAYWHLISDGLGTPTEIWIIFPQYIRIIPDKQKGVSGYIYRRGMEEVRFEEHEIVHFRCMSPFSQFYGIGALMGAIDAFDLWDSMTEYEVAHFNNMARPDMAIIIKQALNDDRKKELEQTVHQFYGGQKKSGKAAVFSKEVVEELIDLGKNRREMSYLAGRKYVREEMTAAHRVPISFLTMESSNRAVAEAGIYQHAKFAVKPYCTRYAQKLTEKLCPRFDDNIFLAHPDPVPQDEELQINKLTSYVRDNILLTNEAREVLSYPPVDGGDQLWKPMSEVPVGGLLPEKQIEETARKFAKAFKEELANV